MTEQRQAGIIMFQIASIRGPSAFDRALDIAISTSHSTNHLRSVRLVRLPNSRAAFEDMDSPIAQDQAMCDHIFGTYGMQVYAYLSLHRDSSRNLPLGILSDECC